jgi:hypothetical protein
MAQRLMIDRSICSSCLPASHFATHGGHISRNAMSHKQIKGNEAMTLISAG